MDRVTQVEVQNFSRRDSTIGADKPLVCAQDVMQRLTIALSWHRDTHGPASQRTVERVQVYPTLLVGLIEE